MDDKQCVIEIEKSDRLFFITEYENRLALTWMKHAAKIFDSFEDAEVFIINRDVRYISEYPTIKSFEEARNH